jgi:hypothetical protein
MSGVFFVASEFYSGKALPCLSKFSGIPFSSLAMIYEGIPDVNIFLTFLLDPFNI